MDIFSGTVFDVGRAPTQNMSVDRYMRQMGAVRTQADVDFEPVQAMDEVWQGGNDAEGAYLSALEAANQFGMRMAAKGIDVTSPDRLNPDSARAAAEFQRLMTRAKQSGNAIRAGHELAKFYTQQRLQEGVMGPKLDPNKPVSVADLNNLINTNPFAKRLADSVDAVNERAKSYDTQVERDYVNADIDKKVAEFETFRDPMIQSGVPPQMVDFLIQNAKNAINRASFDPNATEKMNLEKAKTASQIAANKALTAQRYASAAKTKAGTGKDEQSLILRKGQIKKIQNNYQSAVGSLVNGSIGGKKIVGATFDGSGKSGKIKLEMLGSDGLRRTEELDLSDKASYRVINNILNTVPGEEEFSSEDLSTVSEPKFEWEKSKAGSDYGLDDPNNPILQD